MNIIENQQGNQARMNNPETPAALGTRHRTKPLNDTVYISELPESTTNRSLYYLLNDIRLACLGPEYNL